MHALAGIVSFCHHSHFKLCSFYRISFADHVSKSAVTTVKRIACYKQVSQIGRCSIVKTCAIFINEWQDALVHDVKSYLSNLISKNDYYRHNDPAWSDCDRHNADSHLRSLLLGMNLTLQIAGGDVVLGEWQSVIMAELDGPRERTIRIQAMGI